MEKATSRARITFIHGDNGTNIAATSLQIILPNGAHFVIQSVPRSDGAAVFMIPAGYPGDRGAERFMIEPGACNLFTVNVKETLPPMD
jgi:hypothetical protein